MSMIWGVDLGTSYYEDNIRLLIIILVIIINFIKQ